MRRVKQLIFLGLLSLLIISGCSQRKNPLQMNIGNGGLFENTFEFSSLENILNDPVGRTLLVYLPPGYQEGIASNYKYPILFLLHGFKENGRSYEQFYNIKTIADQMTSTGEIQPMIIVLPDGSGRFGGSFFTNSVTPDGKNFGGRYEDYITKELFDHVLYNYGSTIRGIKYKVTQRDSTLYKDSIIVDTTCKIDTLEVPDCPPESIQYDTTIYKIPRDTTWKDTTATISDDTAYFRQNFGISGHGNGGYGALRIATDYPLMFGSVSAMSAPLSSDSIFLRPLIEAFFVSNRVAKCSDGYRQINIDPDSLDRLSSFFFAMAVTFSPHDPASTDYRSFFKLAPPNKGVDLPFDSCGNIVTSIWQEWLKNDIKTRVLNILNVYPDTLRNLKIYIDCGDKDEFGFNEQAVVFYNALLGKVPASNITFETYSGYPGYPALNNSFIYDRLRKVLKFHSDCFTAP